MKLIIIRHGESEENAQHILQGILPGSLNSTGRDQANKLGQRLSKEKIDHIYCSPVNRCLETLKIMQQHINKTIPVIVTGMIQERDFGQWSGKSHSEINFDKLDIDSPENQAMGVESLDALRLRLSKFLEALKETHPDDTILLVTHNNPIRALLGILLDLSYHEVLTTIKVPNASLTIFDIDDDGEATPVVISETEFLM